MNIIVTVFTLFFLLRLIRKKVLISRKSRILLYLGVALPGADYLLRFINGEIWFQTEELVFHSFFYQSLFWGIAALLIWVYTRRLKTAIRLLLPLIGLLIYAFFSLLSTENISFLAPFSSGIFNLGWITAGYVVPTVLMLVCWLILLFSDLSESLVCGVAVISLAVFIGFSAISFHRINDSLSEFFPEADIVSVFAENQQQTMWRVVAFRGSRYIHTQFHFVQGQRGEIKEQKVLNITDAAQSVLLDPSVRTVFQRAFRNPVIQVEVQNESMSISISELLPLVEPLWIKQIQLRKNGSGRIEYVDVEYGTIL